MKLDLVLTPVAANKWCPYSSEHCFVLMVLVYGHKSRLKLQDCPNTGQFNFTNSLLKLCFILFLAHPEYFQVGSCQSNQIFLYSFSVEHGRKAKLENTLLGKKRTQLEITYEFLFSHFLTQLSFFQPAFDSSENDILLSRGVFSAFRPLLVLSFCFLDDWGLISEPCICEESLCHQPSSIPLLILYIKTIFK